MVERPTHPALEQPEQPRRAKRKDPAKVLADNPARLPPDFKLADVASIQALMIGKADAEQQKRALRYIVETLAGTYDPSYRPGADEGRRETDFAEGRRFVGLRIVAMTRADMAKLRRTIPESDEVEPKS